MATVKKAKNNYSKVQLDAALEVNAWRLEGYRDLFAAVALIGIISTEGNTTRDDVKALDAKMAYDYADAMIAESKKRTKPTRGDYE